MKILHQSKLVFVVISLIIMLPMIQSQYVVENGSNCTIQNITLNAEYNQSGVFIPIESKNMFRNENVNNVNMTFNYSISSPSLFNCSSKSQNIQFFFGSQIKQKVAGIGCLIVGSLISNLNITIFGETSTRYTWSSYQYRSSYSCKGWIFINVTKPQPQPQPKPQPQPQPKPDPQLQNQTKGLIIIGIINTSLIAIMLSIVIFIQCCGKNETAKRNPLIRRKQNNFNTTENF